MNRHSSTHLLKTLQSGLQQTDWQVPELAQQKLIEYILLIDRWNKVHNLTAIRDLEEMITKHILDSLSLLPYISSKDVNSKRPFTLLDVGSGAGLPGIPLSIVVPNLEVTLIEKIQKKTLFLDQVRLTLGLKNVTVVNDRIEAYKPLQLFDWIVSRAFSALPEFLEKAGSLIKPEGKLVAMKGDLNATELEGIPDQYTIVETIPVSVPGLQAKRCLVFMGRKKI